MNVHVDIAAAQAENSRRYLAMEEPVRQATYLAAVLDRLLCAQNEEGLLSAPVHCEIDAVLTAMQVQLATAFGAYEAA